MSIEETKKEYKPLIVAFCCNWCSYAGADLAGTSRLSYPADVKIIRVPCSCRVNPLLSCGRSSGALTASSSPAAIPATAITLAATTMPAADDPAVQHAGLPGHRTGTYPGGVDLRCRGREILHHHERIRQDHP